MSSPSDISVVPPSLPGVDGLLDGPPAGTSSGAWSPVELSHARRPTATTLIVLALLAGFGALVLGALAGVSTLSSSDGRSKAAPPATPAPRAEQQALALLAKPSTERVPFRGSGGALLLAVGSGGRAAILMRAFTLASSGKPYFAWIVGSGRPIRAARLDGAERAVFLDVPLGRSEGVVVAKKPPVRLSATTRLAALRG